MGHTILDLTSQGSPSRRIHERPAADVDALVLHQMGFRRGDSTSRYLNVAAHFIILPNGTLAQLHRITDYLYSSNDLNARSVAVEFAGNFRSDRERWFQPSRFGSHQVSLEQIAAGRFLVKHLKDTIGITHVFAHRQATDGHTNCCGPDIWFNVGQWALTIGLSDGGVGYTVGQGQPIPNSWRAPIP